MIILPIMYKTLIFSYIFKYVSPLVDILVHCLILIFSYTSIYVSPLILDYAINRMNSLPLSLSLAGFVYDLSQCLAKHKKTYFY